VVAGYEHTCALTLSGRAWCWGSNGSGRLGDGTTFTRLRPSPVAGGLLFRQLTAGTQHSCGVSRNYEGYCWGENGIGQVGVAGGTRFLSPVRVIGPM
jgi:alpha-tubulin suppressor-like RCC1 family protein